MPLVRWSVTNYGTKRTKVRVELCDLLGTPANYAPAGEVKASLTVDAAAVRPPGREETTAADPSEADWCGNHVCVYVKDEVTPGPEKLAFRPLLPIGSVDPDNVYQLHVYLEPQDPPTNTGILVTVWGLDGIGGWWLLCERLPVDLA